MFVLQIGSVAQTDSCNIALDQADTVDRAVLLQYSVNNGVSWHVIAQHQPKDFIKAQRVSYNIPLWVPIPSKVFINLDLNEIHINVFYIFSLNGVVVIVRDLFMNLLTLTVTC